MLSSFPLETFARETSYTMPSKATSHAILNVEVVYPEKSDGSLATVLLHYPGGFLVSVYLFLLDSAA
ncbi:hypothetical protein CORC01_09715 [Colletotrichum orchidophilum]|uniref:Uncharacterized protein n=1 Tax=Colletotrichum orchidophilum TaxID=1209926 RepID=A0A1G4B0W6_9PEZI|nr:uncharacterized protein CORC01_09715 [Colletotrichum orchidophilum]OHE95058.1 hypothetical protein CORC01_09715 [Colletotrichum orchidophilum]